MNVIRFAKNWMLPIAIVAGIILYFIYAALPLSPETKILAKQTVGIVQPVLIFIMLFLTYCKVHVEELRPCRWQLWLVLIQGLGFVVPAVLLYAFPRIPAHVLVEGAMLCIICPTATAAAVVTQKLGGSAARITLYTIWSNLLTALLVPLMVPLVHPNPDLSFGASFLLILSKVFPLLLGPFISALALRYVWRKLHDLLGAHYGISFYIWAVSLMLAISVTTKSVVHSTVSLGYQIGLAGVSLAACLLQFYIGKRIGRRQGDAISAGQALGQKNTVLGIWMGYTFFTPVVAVATGFYSVWHNLVNAWQLYQRRKEEGRSQSSRLPSE